MFAGLKNPAERAAETAHWFNNHQIHQSHALGIGRDDARGQKVLVDDLEADGELQDIVLSTFHITAISFSRSNAVKLIENHLGRRFLKQVQLQQLPIPFPVQVPPQPTPGPRRWRAKRRREVRWRAARGKAGAPDGERRFVLTTRAEVHVRLSDNPSALCGRLRQSRADCRSNPPPVPTGSARTEPRLSPHPHARYPKIGKKWSETGPKLRRSAHDPAEPPRNPATTPPARRGAPREAGSPTARSHRPLSRKPAPLLGSWPPRA
jgi:hypothetical protein